MGISRSKSKKIKIFISVIFIVVLVWGWYELNNPSVFPIKMVKIEGSFQHISKSQLQQELTPYLEKGFFAVSVSTLQQRLEKNPWVYEADISRVWPGTLVIKLIEQKPVARWGKTGLINSQGKLFTPKSIDFKHKLPIVYAVNQKENVTWQEYLAMQAILGKLKLTINKLTIDARGAQILELSNGVEVKLGRLDILKRLRRLVTV